MATGRKGPGHPDIPDLNRVESKDPRPAPNPVASRLSSPPDAGPPSKRDYFGGASFDDEDFADAGVAIALDVEGPRQGETRAANASFGGGASDDADLDVFEKTSASSVSQSRAAVAPPAKKWPSAASPDSASIHLDAVEIAVLSDYGAPPAGFLAAPPYALRVFRRRRALAEEVAKLAAELAAAERERDFIVIAMVRELRGKALLTEEGEKLFEPVVAIEKTALDRRSALAGTSAEYDERAREIDVRGAALREQTEAHRAVVAEREAACAEQSRLLARADARKKRLYIEVRAIVDASEKSGGKMTGEQEAKLAALEADVARHKPELDLQTQNEQAARAAFASEQVTAREFERQARELERLRAALDRQFQKQIGVRNQGVTEAEQQQLDALAAVGRGLLAARGKVVDVQSDVLDAISRADAVVHERATNLEKHVRALDAHDADAYRNGFVVLAAAALFVVVLLAVLLHPAAKAP